MRYAKKILAGLLNVSWCILLLLPAAAPAQTGSRVAFSINPTEFAIGQKSSAVLSVFCVSTVPLTVSPGDTFSFFFDASVGTVSSIKAPPSVASSSLLAGDFAGTSGPNQVTITYTGQTKAFSFGDTVSVEVAFTAGAKVGTGKVSFSSRFTGSVNGNLPYTTVSIVDFANSGVTTVVHDQTLIGNGTAGSPLGVTVPLTLGGSTLAADEPILFVFNTTQQGTGIEAQSGDGGTAVIGIGNVDGSTGVAGTGGTGIKTGGGTGVVATGGPGNGVKGGTGLEARGGGSSGSDAGVGVVAQGGDSDNGTGGPGVSGIGGMGSGSGHTGGAGLFGVQGLGTNGATKGLAGIFNGDVEVSGSLSKGGGSFKIDHPLDPEHKYLYHSFVESPDMMNIYNGIARLDSNGEATVVLPDWLEALNTDFRYTLTAIGAPAPNLYIAEEVTGNRFKIAGGSAGAKVSWALTGIRKDAWANAHRIPVEEDKSERERGHYLHPELFNQPEELGVEWARHPELMRQIKERRLKEIEELIQRTSQQ